MPLIKKTVAATDAAPQAQTTTVESGTAAAINRLKKTTTEKAEGKQTNYRQDSDEVAHGKTRCALLEAAYMSPAIAGMRFTSMEEFLALCKQAADFGVAYTFGDKH